MDLKIDPERSFNNDTERDIVGTGILVRAQNPEGKWINADIMELEKSSLTAWLRSRGGENEWAESVVYILLGYDR